MYKPGKSGEHKFMDNHTHTGDREDYVKGCCEDLVKNSLLCDKVLLGIQIIDPGRNYFLS